MRARTPFWLVSAAVALIAAGEALADVLSINAGTSDPAPRQAWQELSERFARENPDIQVAFNIYDQESYKKSIRNWLTSGAPDVIYWNAGYRMRQLAIPGLLEDVSDLFTPEVKKALGAGPVELVSEDGRQFGVPYAHYQIGLYYRKDLFDKAGAAAPRDWPGLLEACDKLRSAGLNLVAIGSKDLWPTAGWFDYIDLRLNGYAFHRALMDGKIPYTDDRVRSAFEHWGQLIERGCFNPGHVGMSWQEAQMLIYRGKAAMMLIGNFVVPNFPPEIRERMGFIRFPTIDPTVGNAEDAPMNSLHIPARARNRRDARRFLSFVLRRDVQEELARKLKIIPVNREANIPEDRFLEAGRELLAGADHLTQYFDRDTSEEVASVAMKGFQEFMVAPDRLDAILETIERARRRVYD